MTSQKRRWQLFVALFTVAGLAAAADSVRAQSAEDETAPMAQPAPQVASPGFSSGALSPAETERLAQFTQTATMVSLTEVIGSSVALLAGASTCDEKADLAYSGTIANNEWTTQLTGTYAGRPVTLVYEGDFNAVHGLGNYKGSGGFGHESWSGAGSMAFSPGSEFMSLNGSARIGNAGANLEFEANWLMSQEGDHEVANAMTVVKQQRRPIIIIVIQGTWRHTTYWLHSVIIDIFTFRTATGQPRSCRINIKESGDQTAKGHFRVNGTAAVERLEQTMPRLQPAMPKPVIE